MNKNLCRICAKKLIETSKAHKLFDKRARKLLLQIEELTGLLLENIKEMPEYICECCRFDLAQAVNFRELCIKTNKYLHMKIKVTLQDNKDKTRNTIITGIPALLENAIHDETPLTTDQLMILEYKPDMDEYRDVNVDLIHLDVETNENQTDKCLNYMVNSDTSITDSVTPKRETNSQKLKKANNKSKRKEKTSQIRKTFICDQCGNHIIGLQHFKIHLHRHTGDKEFECELCPDKFFTKQELNRHMRRHTGERPFSCQHCGRSFSDYSTRVKHERIHTNERPFLCTHCPKSFNTSYILKNHILTHTGERPFKCDICYKAFQSKTNLLTHFRSIMHKMNAEKQKSATISS